MRKYVITIEDDVCMKNGKTEVMQSDLLRKIAEYGTVEDYSTVISVIESTYQTKLDNMAKSYNAIAERNVDDYELALLKAHRAGVNNSVQVVEAENSALKDSLKKAEEKTVSLASSLKSTLEAYTS